MDTRKIEMMSDLPILISKFIEYELCLSEFHLTLISQTVRKLSKVFNQPSSFSRSREIFSPMFIISND